MVGFFDVKYYKWIAAIVGWYFAGILGAIIAYSIVSRYTRRLTADISFEIKASKPTFGVACQLTAPSIPELSLLYL